jgi:hypothetical protein
LFNKNNKSAFYIGPIIGGNNKGFGIHGYNSVGEWKNEYVLDYEEILRIGFNDRYSKNFNRFVRQTRRQICKKIASKIIEKNRDSGLALKKWTP